MTRRQAVAAIGIPLANLALVGWMAGYIGASRAFAVGVHTLLEEHAAAVLISLGGTVLLAFALGRTFQRSRLILLAIALAFAADAAAAAAITLVFDEMRRIAGIALPRAIFTETIAGLQLAAIAAGLTIGALVRRRWPTGGGPDIDR